MARTATKPRFSGDPWADEDQVVVQSAARTIGQALHRNRLPWAPWYVAGGAGVLAEAAYLAPPWAGLLATAALGGGTWVARGRVPDEGWYRRAVAGVGGAYTGVLAAATAGLQPLAFGSLPGGIPAWAYASATLGSLVAWHSSELVKLARTRQDLAEAWPADARAMGAPQLRLRGGRIDFLPTLDGERPGRRYHVWAPRGQEVGKALNVGAIASTYGTRREWVNVTESTKNPRCGTITVYFSDPWAGVDNRHPAVIGSGAWSAPTRTVREPLPIGLSTGERKLGEGHKVAELPLWTKHGAIHTLIGGVTGSGKTVVLNSVAASALACRDVLLWCIDVAKDGIEAGDWGPGSIDWVATSFAEADRMLDAALLLIKARSGQRWKPSVKTPLVVLFIDELKSLTMPSGGGWGHLAGKLEEVARLARSAGISLLVATQYPDQEAFAYQVTLREQLKQGIALKFRKTASAEFVLGQETSVDISRWSDDTPGLFVAKAGGMGPDQVWRGFDVSEAERIREIGDRYGTGRPVLEPAAVARLGELYSKRQRPTRAADHDEAGQEAEPTQEVPMATPNEPAAGGLSAEDLQVFNRITAERAGFASPARPAAPPAEPAVAAPSSAGLSKEEMRERLRAMNAEPVVEIPPRNLTPIGDPEHMSEEEREAYERLHSPEGAAWRAEAAARYVPEALTAEEAFPVLALINAAGEAGVSMQDIADGMGRSVKTAQRRVGVLVGEGVVERIGNATNGRRYRLTARVRADFGLGEPAA